MLLFHGLTILLLHHGNTIIFGKIYLLSSKCYLFLYSIYAYQKGNFVANHLDKEGAAGVSALYSLASQLPSLLQVLLLLLLVTFGQILLNYTTPNFCVHYCIASTSLVIFIIHTNIYVCVHCLLCRWTYPFIPFSFSWQWDTYCTFSIGFWRPMNIYPAANGRFSSVLHLWDSSD